MAGTKRALAAGMGRYRRVCNRHKRKGELMMSHPVMVWFRPDEGGTVFAAVDPTGELPAGRLSGNRRQDQPDSMMTDVAAS